MNRTTHDCNSSQPDESERQLDYDDEPDPPMSLDDFGLLALLVMASMGVGLCLCLLVWLMAKIFIN